MLFVMRQCADQAPFGFSMIAHGGLDDATAKLRQLDDHAASIGVVGQASDLTGLLKLP